MTEHRETEQQTPREDEDGQKDLQVDRREDADEDLPPAAPTPEEKPETQETGEAGTPPDDLSKDPAYEPDDEALKGIKGG